MRSNRVPLVIAWPHVKPLAKAYAAVFATVEKNGRAEAPVAQEVLVSHLGARIASRGVDEEVLGDKELGVGAEARKGLGGRGRRKNCIGEGGVRKVHRRLRSAETGSRADGKIQAAYPRIGGIFS